MSNSALTSYDQLCCWIYNNQDTKPKWIQIYVTSMHKFPMSEKGINMSAHAYSGGQQKRLASRYLEVKRLLTLQEGFNKN